MSQVEELRDRIQKCDESQPFIFISYKRDDAEKVYPKVIELQKKGVNVWIDKEMKGHVGKDWQTPAFEALCNYNCKAILFFVSKKALVSAPILAELLYPQEEEMTFTHNCILPILTFDLDDLLGEYNSVSEYVKGQRNEFSQNLISKEKLKPMFPASKFSDPVSIYEGIGNQFNLSFRILKAASLLDEKVILAVNIQEIYDTCKRDYREVLVKDSIVTPVKPKKNNCMVSFYNEGTVTEQIVEKGSKLAEPDAPTKEGFCFNGWMYEQSGTERIWDFDQDVVNSDINLCAKFVDESPTEGYISLQDFSKKYNNNTFKKDTYSEFRLVGNGEFDQYSTGYFDSAFDLTWSFVMNLLSEKGIGYIEEVNEKHSGLKNPIFITSDVYEKRDDQNKYRQIEVKGLENYYMYRHFGQYQWIDSVLKPRLVEYGLPMDQFGFKYKTETNSPVPGKGKNHDDKKKKGTDGDSKPLHGGITGPVTLNGAEGVNKIDGQFTLEEFLSKYDNKTFQAKSCKYIKLIGINGCEKYSIDKNADGKAIETARQLVFNFAMRQLDEMGMEYINLVNDGNHSINPIFITEEDHNARKARKESVTYTKVTSKSVSGYSMCTHYSEYDWLKISLVKQLKALNLSMENFCLVLE